MTIGSSIVQLPTNEWNQMDENTCKQDRQALLKAKYCPRAATALRTQKTTKKRVTLTFDIWPWNSIEF